MDVTNKVGVREFIAVILLLIGSKLADNTPAILVQEARNSFWMIPLVALAVFIPPFLLFLHLLKKHQNKNLIELVNHILGRYAGFVLGLLIFIVTFLTLIIDSRSFVEELSVLYYPKTPLLVLLGVLLLICGLGARLGLQHVMAASWVILPYVKVSVIFLFLLALTNNEWRRIFPLWGDGFQILLIEGVRNVSLFTDLFLLTMAYTSLRRTTAFHRASYWGLGIVSLELCIAFLLYATMFDYKSIDTVAYHFHEVTQYIHLGIYFTNIETYFMFFWLLAVIIRFIIYLYFATWIFAAVFNIKNFRQLVFPLAVLTIWLGILPENSIELTLLYRKELFLAISLLFLTTPFLLWAVEKMKGGIKA
ncbi:GerAB/ArcD/ProY family transporter [Halalkalibacter oceani]|uniref:GerAB/ArcD/ProY family transporter n=1 Tax=Halalkalibacter oceani TaxID=1653776 RepID=UPI0033949E50